MVPQKQPFKRIRPTQIGGASIYEIRWNLAWMWLLMLTLGLNDVRWKYQRTKIHNSSSLCYLSNYMVVGGVGVFVHMIVFVWWLIPSRPPNICMMQIQREPGIYDVRATWSPPSPPLKPQHLCRVKTHRAACWCWWRGWEAEHDFENAHYPPHCDGTAKHTQLMGRSYIRRTDGEVVERRVHPITLSK